jgi:general secretion pathway protein D
LLPANILPPFADNTSPVNRADAINPGPIGADPGRSLLFQFVSRNFRARLQMLEDKNRVTEVAAPLLMTANNEVSQIFVGTTQPITIGFTPSTVITTGITTAGTSQATPITTLQNIGTSLLITPNINADRTVTLRVHEEKSTVIPDGAQIPLPNANGTGFTNVPVDVVARQNYTGTIVAKDGLAIAIGGLIDERVFDAREEIPVLGRIPYLGIFFRRQNTRRERHEMIIMIRPFVLTTPCESMNASRSLLQQLSIHPSIVDDSLGMIHTFNPQEVLRPSPPNDCWEQIFKVHMITPKDF